MEPPASLPQVASQEDRALSFYVVNINRFREPWYQMSQEDRDANIEETKAKLAKVRGDEETTVVNLKGLSYGTDNIWVGRFPSMDVLRDSQMVFKTATGRYLDTQSFMGLEEGFWGVRRGELGL